MSKPVLLLYREADRVQPYHDAAVAGGLEPTLVSPEEAVDLNDFAGLLLTGGSDVDPALYGEARHPETEPPDPARDRAEYALLEQALSTDLPVLAICRGLQILNVFHGGTLHQHLVPVERHCRESEDRAEAAHGIEIADDSLLRKIAESENCPVNSRHHQAVKDVGAGLRVTARSSDDKVIEALEQRDRRFVVAVQWHPEDQVFRYPEQLRLFQAFRQALG